MSDLDEYYSSGKYRTQTNDSIIPDHKDIFIQIARARQVTLQLFQHFESQILAAVDIGCSIGALVAELRFTCGVNAVGVDPDKTWVRIGLSGGLPIFHYTHEVASSPEFNPDVITYVHTLEHLSCPIMMLQLCRKKWPNAKVYAQVPLFGGGGSTFVGYNHLIGFDKHSLKTALEMAGYRVVRVEEECYPLMRFAADVCHIFGVPDEKVTVTYHYDRFFRLRGAYRNAVLGWMKNHMSFLKSLPRKIRALFQYDATYRLDFVTRLAECGHCHYKFPVWCQCCPACLRKVGGNDESSASGRE